MGTEPTLKGKEGEIDPRRNEGKEREEDVQEGERREWDEEGDNENDERGEGAKEGLLIYL